MRIDVGTLSVVTVFVSALLGALLVFAGLLNRSIRAPIWWGAAHIIGAAGLGLVAARGVVPNYLSIEIGNGLVMFGYGLTWAGARVFGDRKVPPPVVVVAPLIWILSCQLPVVAGNVNLRVAIVSAMLAILAAATAVEFWRDRDEPLMSRGPIVTVLLAHAAMLLARILVISVLPLVDNDTLMRSAPFALLSFGTLLYAVVMAFLLLTMTKERTELAHKIASLVDPLSGVANRRAFLSGSSRLFARQKVDHEPLAMLLFDLDHFKEINDRLGHAAGDQVLQAFARSATATLGSDVLFGRIGGEEFASLLPVGDFGEAIAVADRVRRNFAEAAAHLSDRGLAPTVSVGVTLGLDAKTEVEDLLLVADEALYRAKANGRNRVEANAPDTGCEAKVTRAPSIVPIVPILRANRVDVAA